MTLCSRSLGSFQCRRRAELVSFPLRSLNSYIYIYILKACLEENGGRQGKKSNVEGLGYGVICPAVVLERVWVSDACRTRK